ncbi:MAG: hypothetical protein ACOCYV_01130 [Planctomycetota bacterium]
MPLLAGCLSLFFPRLVILLVVLVSDYIGTAYQSVLWPLLGFFFLPLTTLAYAWAYHAGDGHVAGFGLAVVVVAVLLDLGLVGHGGHGWRNHRKRKHERED